MNDLLKRNKNNKFAFTKTCMLCMTDGHNNSPFFSSPEPKA